MLTPQQRFDQALAHLQAGRLAEADQGFRALLSAFPRHAGAMALLGVVAMQTGRADEAVGLLRGAVEIDPRNALVHNYLADALAGRGDIGGAVRHLQAVAELQPSAAVYGRLGIVAHNLDAGAAAEAFRRALELDPLDAASHTNLAVILTDDGRLSEALTHHRAAVELAPGLARVRSNYGLALLASGDVGGALGAYDEAVALAPQDPVPHALKVLALHYDPRRSAAEVYAEHVEWARRHADPLTADAEAAGRAFANTPDPDRPIRVGYVSGDLRRHAVAHFLEPVLARHCPDRVETVCYSTNGTADDYTDRLRAAASAWRDVPYLPQDRLAELIREDRIDVLVDLSGHTGQNRLAAFARRPAPVQVGWLGYPGFTGMAALDYWITDPLCDPPDEPASPYPPQRVVRLPETFACFLPPPEAPAGVGPSPARSKGYVTFGSFNVLAKLNDDVLDAWASVLRRVPGARMVLGATALGDAGVRDALATRFRRRGVERGRLTFHGALSMPDYLAAHAEVDLLLDTFPFTGHTVSLHGLWMGCGLVALRGDRHVARRGAAVLHLLGLDEWVADTPAAFVDRAVEAAADLDHLADVRRTLRDRMRGSALMHYDRFVANLESAYRAMWRTWCLRGRGEDTGPCNA